MVSATTDAATEVNKLHVSDPHLDDAAAATSLTADGTTEDGSKSPVRPPVSPITPVASFAQLANAQADIKIEHFDLERPNASQDFMIRPSSLPLNEEDNADATALKAAISVLQLQKLKSKRDIETLRDLKGRAAQDPEAFAEQLKAGTLTYEPAPGNVLAATFEGEELDDDEDELMGSDADSATSRFPKIPNPQNVIRCPPINWNKYHIIGESLDRMHEDQRRRPAPGDPWGAEQREHFVAAPYSPFRDKINSLPPPMQTRRSSKKPSLS